MKIAIIDTYYPGFLNKFYEIHRATERLTYEKHLRSLLESCFGTSDFYTYHFKKLGVSAIDIIANDEKIQKKWAKQEGFQVNFDLQELFHNLPYIYRYIGRPSWMQDITLAQIQSYKPDIVYLQDLSLFNPNYLQKVKKYSKLLVGQIASPLPPDEYTKQFDLIVTSFPHYKDIFKSKKVVSEYLPLAFETRLDKKIKDMKRVYDVSFVGSFSPYHRNGTKVLEQLALHMPVHVWGNGLQFLSPFSPLRKNYHGAAWGIDMYKILAQSKIVVNRHINSSSMYANNMRLFEVTGMGALLLTDSKVNLNDFFNIGIEIESYKNASDLIEKVGFYLQNEPKRKKLALAGQRKTKKYHSYSVRIKQLKKILEKYI